MHRTTSSDTCLGCHVPAEHMHAVSRNDAPAVPPWMVDDRRGCAGCHAVLGTR